MADFRISRGMFNRAAAAAGFGLRRCFACDAWYNAVMEPTLILSLNDHWQVEYFELEPDLFEFGALAEPVPDLESWRCGGRYDDSWGATLQRTFDLEIAEFCVRYQLAVERAPGVVILYLNGRRMGTFDGSQPFLFDVTDYVTLEDNRIAFRVECRDEAGFSGVRLLQFPCES